MKKWGICLLAAGLLFGSCKSDDDVNEVSIEDQNQVDDEAIVQYLEDHYFSPERGLIKKYDEDDESDDEYPNLKSLGTKLNSGVWIIKRPGVIAEGPAITTNAQDSILISYDIKYFRASNQDLTEGQTLYNSITPMQYGSTINGAGTPNWDLTYFSPQSFYHVKLTQTMIENDINEQHFIMEGFLEGLKQFNSTQTTGVDLYNFQGAIIVPSRAAFGRDFVYWGGQLRNDIYRDLTFVINFELHKFVPRNN